MQKRHLGIIICFVLYSLMLFAILCTGISFAEELAVKRTEYVEYSGAGIMEWLKTLNDDMETVRTSGDEDVLQYRFADGLTGRMVNGFSSYTPLADVQDVKALTFDLRASADELMFAMYCFQGDGLAAYTDRRPIDAQMLLDYMSAAWQDLKGFDFAVGRASADGMTWYWEPVYYATSAGDIRGDELYVYVLAVTDGADQRILKEMKVYNPKPAQYAVEQYMIAEDERVTALLKSMDTERPLGSARTNLDQYQTLTLDSTGEAVRAIQKRLSDLGFMTSSVDSYYGPMTQEAVRAYQQAKGLPITGEADAYTQLQLLSETDERALVTGWLERNGQ